MLDEFEMNSISVLQLLIVYTLFAFTGHVFGWTFESNLAWLGWIIFWGYVIIRVIEWAVMNNDWNPFIDNAWFALINVVVFVFQWWLVLWPTYVFWIETANIWWLLYPNILFAYWVILSAFITAKVYRCPKEE